MRLIDADALVERIYAMKPSHCTNVSDDTFACGLVQTVYDVINFVKEAPTVDAVPLVHGEWTTKRTLEHDGEWYCSVCGYEPIVMTDDMKYCPGCGAKMNLKEE